jgi:ABC-type glycerol-3-phosphate transport system substrate-binding protein
MGAVLLMAGCQQSVSTESTTGQETQMEEDLNLATGQETQTEEDLNLTTLVVDNPHMTTDVVDAVNNYLREQNCSYRIRGINLLQETRENYNLTDVGSWSHTKYIEEYIDSGKQVDIVYGAEDQYTCGHWSFINLYQDGYLACLEDYMDTEAGKTLYASMPEAYWEALRACSGGQLYGICGYPYNLKTNPVYFVNKELMEKYNLTEEDLTKPIGELKALLEEIQRGEEEDGTFYALRLMPWNFYGTTSQYGFNWRIMNIVMDEEQPDPSASFLLDDEQLQEMVTDTYELYQDENIKATMNVDVNLNHYFLLVDFGGNPGTFTPVDMDYCTYQYQDQGVLLYPYGDEVVLNNGFRMCAISASSEHQEEAFDFLSRIYSSQELSEIVSMGTDLVEENGVLYHQDGSDAIITSYMGNGFITRPSGYELKDKNAVLKNIYDRAQVSKYTGFWFDETSESALTAGLSQIKGIEELFTGNYASAEDFFEEQKQTFTDAGGEEYLKIIQEAYDAFKEN